MSQNEVSYLKRKKNFRKFQLGFQCTKLAWDLICKPWYKKSVEVFLLLFPGDGMTCVYLSAGLNGGIIFKVSLSPKMSMSKILRQRFMSVCHFTATFYIMDFYLKYTSRPNRIKPCFNTDSWMEKVQGCFQGFSKIKIRGLWQMREH